MAYCTGGNRCHSYVSSMHHLRQKKKKKVARKCSSPTAYANERNVSEKPCRFEYFLQYVASTTMLCICTRALSVLFICVHIQNVYACTPACLSLHVFIHLYHSSCCLVFGFRDFFHASNKFPFSFPAMEVLANF